MSFRVGFMQGRLSPMVDGKIQAFPWDNWQNEFPIAKSLGIDLMEWTLDHARLDENPLMTTAGQQQILALSKQHNLKVGSLTGDIFMQAPFWRVNGEERIKRLNEFDQVTQACVAIGIRYVVVPLVDNGAMHSDDEETTVINELTKRSESFRKHNICIAFECDYEPKRLASFIGKLPKDSFGINYDIGNSAALDFDCGEEITAYGQRIVNVHIKDRIKGGTTVPLGQGNADLTRALKLIVDSGYQGNYILQTARATDGDHAGTLKRYLELSKNLIQQALN